ncbi:MAG: hypothetical protein P8163_20245 [Candidatus Thiodiazotropha sp.]
MLEAVTTNMPILPEWAKIVAFNLLGIYVILQLIHLILKKLQTAELRSAVSALKNLSEEAISKAGGALQLPVERPKLALFALVIDAALLYVFAFIIFALFAVFFMLGASSTEIPFSKRMIAFGISALLVIASRWYYASAERQRIALVERWKNKK